MAGIEVDKPVVQILGIKHCKSAGHDYRYWLCVSDGKYHWNCVAMDAQLNNYVTEGQLSMYAIIRIDRLTTSMGNQSGEAM